ncbi:hypothetical protein HYH03_006080 [Edaphochlamys debaryana]|uniref:Uncharacterized protein n=1 Tax=Edaphochlamys debaryana TaxID=47281 RepID=A0A835Y4I4_9CHLO|nr:hypothetical protein HYH03_006080 [Edaphochlamys debaryana]|eukprot:KAG2495841.1 hypothetical protein HYH03_006080 [Edaphochlamys debaryana]
MGRLTLVLLAAATLLTAVRPVHGQVMTLPASGGAGATDGALLGAVSQLVAGFGLPGGAVKQVSDALGRAQDFNIRDLFETSNAGFTNGLPNIDMSNWIPNFAASANRPGAVPAVPAVLPGGVNLQQMTSGDASAFVGRFITASLDAATQQWQSMAAALPGSGWMARRGVRAADAVAAEAGGAAGAGGAGSGLEPLVRSSNDGKDGTTDDGKDSTLHPFFYGYVPPRPRPGFSAGQGLPPVGSAGPRDLMAFQQQLARDYVAQQEAQRQALQAAQGELQAYLEGQAADARGSLAATQKAAADRAYAAFILQTCTQYGLSRFFGSLGANLAPISPPYAAMYSQYGAWYGAGFEGLSPQGENYLQRVCCDLIAAQQQGVGYGRQNQPAKDAGAKGAGTSMGAGSGPTLFAAFASTPRKLLGGDASEQPAAAEPQAASALPVRSATRAPPPRAARVDPATCSPSAWTSWLFNSNQQLAQQFEAISTAAQAFNDNVQKQLDERQKQRNDQRTNRRNSALDLGSGANLYARDPRSDGVFASNGLGANLANSLGSNLNGAGGNFDPSQLVKIEAQGTAKR